MLTYSKLSKKPSSFRSFTGLTVMEFGKLYSIIEEQYDAYEKKRLDREDRIRAIGQGRPFKLFLKERLLILLMYFRMYITYELESYLFDLNLSNICRNIKRIEPLIKKCIPLPAKVHRRAKRIGTVEELLKYFPEMKAFLDATEQEIPRPKNKRRRKNYYSGKKKRHTVKTQFITNKKGLIIHKTRYRHGKKHDYQVWKDTHPSVPPDVELDMDLGYQGMKEDFPKIKSQLPIKKLPKKELTRKEKRYNKKHSRERVVIEHAISRIKKFRIIGEEFRNKLNSYDTKMSIVTGLINFRIMLNEGMDVLSFVR